MGLTVVGLGMIMLSVILLVLQAMGLDVNTVTGLEWELHQ